MTEDKFFERLRHDAKPLRYAGDDFLPARMAARVRERLNRPATVSQFLAAWFRPIAASLAAIILSLTLGLTWSASHHDIADSISQNPIEFAMAGETFGVGD